MIQGVSMAMMTAGGVLTPLLVGSLRDITGGYQWAFLAMAIATLVSIPLLSVVRPPTRAFGRYRVVGPTETIM